MNLWKRVLKRNFTVVKALLRYATFATQLDSHCCCGKCRKRKVSGWCHMRLNHKVTQRVCCEKHCTKQNQVLLYKTNAVTHFLPLHSVTSLLKLASQYFCVQRKKNSLFENNFYSLNSMAKRLRDRFEETLHSNIMRLHFF